MNSKLIILTLTAVVLTGATGCGSGDGGDTGGRGGCGGVAEGCGDGGGSGGGGTSTTSAVEGPSDAEMKAAIAEYLKTWTPPDGDFGHLECCYWGEIKRLEPETIDTFSGLVTGYPVRMDVEFDQYDGLGGYVGVNDFVLSDDGIVEFFYNDADNLDFQIRWL